MLQIVKYRDEHGQFNNREEIANIKGIGPKTIEQAMWILTYSDGEEKLDMTAIHPESYPVANAILENLGLQKMLLVLMNL